MIQTDIGHGRGWLTPEAAASIARIDRALGDPLQITEAGRTYERQMQHWETYQRVGYPIALHPDTPSIHQLGNAIDTDEGQQHVPLLAQHGWKRTVFRNGVLVEPWHFEYSTARDQHLHDPNPTGDEDMPLSNEDISRIASAVWNHPIGENGEKGKNDQPAWVRLGVAAHASWWATKRLGGSILNKAKSITALLRG